MLTVISPSPAHAYTYPFEPNPNWSSFYAGSAEILQYFKGFADKYDLLKYINLEHKVTSAIWDEGQGICMLQLRILELSMSTNLARQAQSIRCEWGNRRLVSCLHQWHRLPQQLEMYIMSGIGKAFPS